ncbi:MULTISPECIES: hypothetical protein [Pseudomonas]|uniref:hypothetical protein n=1 Tax=Pseudomonas TaxID=286 RepID=UPI001BCB7E3C|nr:MULTISPECIES: hypothetical protein [Pseudomonas]UXY50696.1 hypothetical protein N9L84_17130 [Pseudomonas tohonis]BBP83909.1 hypothetical protein PHLH8_35510 [Pseudomonas sp. Pc102]
MNPARTAALQEALWIALEATLAAAEEAGMEREQLLAAARGIAASALKGGSGKAEALIAQAALRRHIGQRA